MNDLPRHTLARIIAEHGREICAAPKRVEALLRDLCGAHRREINIIVGALEEHVAADLISAAAGGKSAPREVLLARQAARLRDNLAYTPEAALWAVETWAFALGILSATELQERERTKSAEAGQDNEPPQPSPPPKPSPPLQPPPQPPVRVPQRPPANPASTSPPPQSSATTSQPQRGKAYPPAPRRTPTVNPNVGAPAGVPAPQNNSPSLPTHRTSPRRGGLTLRGCLIGVVLIIILIVAAVVVVPAVIFLLQEEQAQPTINDPRIR